MIARGPWLLSVLAVLVLLMMGTERAWAGWSFNWYCSGCSKIGARTTGTIGPFPTYSACESARSQFRSQYPAGDVTTGSCSGSDDTPRPQPGPSGGGRRQRPDYTPPGPGIPPPPPGPSYEEQRREEEQRRQEEERRRQEEEARKQAEFRRQRDETVKQLKGGGGGALQLKGEPGSPFGIKGGASGDLGIKRGGGRDLDRNLSTARRRLNCAADIAKGSLDAAKSGDIEEVKYLGRETAKALNGEVRGVQCNDEDPHSQTSLKGLENSGPVKIFFQKLLVAAEREATTIRRANGALNTIGRKADELLDRVQGNKDPGRQEPRPVSRPGKEEKLPPKEEKPKMAEIGGGGADPLARVRDLQRQINDKRSKEYDQVRDLQREINAQNARKHEALQRLDEYEEQTKRVVKDPSSATQAAQKIR